MSNLEIIASLVAVNATPVGDSGKFCYVAVDADGKEYPLGKKLAARENVFFYAEGYVNGNNKERGALNGHCSYGKNPDRYYQAIKSIRVTFAA
jgi:hypothetical protein